MRKKEGRVVVRSPFEGVSHNWELISRIQSALRKEIVVSGTSTVTGVLLDKSQLLLLIVETLKLQGSRQVALASQLQSAQDKLAQQQLSSKGVQQSFRERLRLIAEESRGLRENNQRLRKTLAEAEEKDKVAMEEAKTENTLLRTKLTEQQRKKVQLLQLVEQKQREIDLLELKLNLVLKKQFKTPLKKPPQPWDQNSFVCLLLEERISKVLLSMIQPGDAAALISLNKISRAAQLESADCLKSMLRGAAVTAGRRAAALRNHLSYFQKRYNGIPQQLVQKAYFGAYVLKEAVSPWVQSALSHAAGVFDGKSEDENTFEGLQTLGQDEEGKLRSVARRKSLNFLSLESSIVEECIEQLRGKEQRVGRELQSMWGRLQRSQQLFRADEEGLRQFWRTLGKHFARLFVAGKQLCGQARALQQLNTFLLKELGQWDRQQIDRRSEVEDLKAQLHAEQRLKVFLTERGVASEQKALSEEGLRLTLQTKLGQQQAATNSSNILREELQRKCEQQQKLLKEKEEQLQSLKDNYGRVEGRLNKLLQELNLVKETMIRMNLH